MIISLLVSPWSFPVVIVKKSDGTMRFCMDYRRLNSITRKDSHPLPQIFAALDALGGVRYFSTFDLLSNKQLIGYSFVNQVIHCYWLI